MQIRCPQGHLLEVPPEHAGQKVMCPACQTVMLVPVPARPSTPMAILVEPAPNAAHRTAAAEDEGYIEPPRGDDRADLAKVRLGLAFHIAKVFTALLGGCLLVGLTFLLIGQSVQAAKEARGFNQPAPPGLVGNLRTIVVLSLIYQVAVTGLGLAGSALCLFTPSHTGARAFIIASLALELIGLALVLPTNFVEEPPRLAGQGQKAPEFTTVQALRLVAVVAQVVAYFCFFAFLKRLAEYKRKRWLARDTDSVMWFMIYIIIGMVAAVVLSIIFVLVAPPAGALLFAIFVLAGVVAGLIWLIRYVKLLGTFRSVLP